MVVELHQDLCLVVDGLVVEEVEVVQTQHQVDKQKVVLVVVQQVDTPHFPPVGQEIMLCKQLVAVVLVHLVMHLIDMGEVVVVVYA
jgi:hypothetical protein